MSFNHDVERMFELEPTIDLVAEADRRFFKRFPRRKHRVRFACDAEVERFAIVNGRPFRPAPAGMQHYTVVRQVRPGFRLRVGYVAVAGLETDLTEVDALAVWREVEKREQAVSRIMGALS